MLIFPGVCQKAGNMIMRRKETVFFATKRLFMFALPEGLCLHVLHT